MFWLTMIYASATLCISPFGAKLQTKEISGKSWVVKSNQYTALLVDLEKKYTPEYGSSQGFAEYDTQISVPTAANQLARREEGQLLVKKYTASLNTEKDMAVRQDLKVLIGYLNLGFRRQDFENSRKVPFLNAATDIYAGLESLLDAQTAESRRSAAVLRMRKYAGMEPGYRPLTEILRERTAKQIAGKNMIYPSARQMEVDLSRSSGIVSGIAELCKQYHLKGWEEPYQKLKTEIEEYNIWLKQHVLGKARTDNRLPAEEYALGLEEYGVDIPPAELAIMAHAAFTSIQNEMKPIAKQIAEQRHFSSADYRDVIAELKKEQIHGDSIIPLYERHLKDIEGIIRKQHLATLPARPAMIRLATAGETSRIPAPYMVPPPFLNNTGQRGVFVLPLNLPAAPGERAINKYDDFTFDAVSWTLIAHESRPGHEMQFDKMIEEGVSQARALYASNSTNLEGWGLYAEYIVMPYMPLEGQLLSLNYRLLRAARAFMDPEIQAGKITPQQVLEVLTKDLVYSKAYAQQEVERYSLSAPGQANSYFYGFTRMIKLRKDTEAALGAKFNAMRFHDFILSQGLLPPALIREAVINEFIPSEN
ncbi:DUF885 domain-containing protein [Pedobacter westerhofensis]